MERHLISPLRCLPISIGKIPVGLLQYKELSVRQTDLGRYAYVVQGSLQPLIDSIGSKQFIRGQVWILKVIVSFPLIYNHLNFGRDDIHLTILLLKSVWLYGKNDQAWESSRKTPGRFESHSPCRKTS